MKTAYDTNGNRVLKIEGSDLGTKRGFSIQTMPNLPKTHRDGIGKCTESEVHSYVSQYGTARQKELFGIH